MSKEEFLKELEQKLHVLNEQERRDVLEEYSQHIDLKIESGQTEEEAVGDFGRPEELVAELLDAYHINSEYAASEEEGQAPKDAGIRRGIPGIAARMAQCCGKVCAAVKAAAGRLARGTAGLCSRALCGLRRLFETCGKGLGGAWRSLREFVRGLFKRLFGRFRRKKEGIGPEGGEAAAREGQSAVGIWQRFRLGREKRRRSREAFFERQRQSRKRREEERQRRRERRQMEQRDAGNCPAGALAVRALRSCGHFAVRCASFLWKVCLFAAALPAIMLGLGFLFFGGIVLILLLQGYPVIGVAVGTMGVIMSSFGISALILSWVFTEKGARREDEGDRAQ